MIDEIRRDEAIRSWHLWLCVYLSIVMESTAVALGFWVNWFPLALFLFFTLVKRRASHLDLALPLPARRLWLAHVLAIGLGGAAVLASGFLRRAFFDPNPEADVPVWSPGAGAEMIDGTLLLGAGLVIAVIVLQSRRPALAQVTLTLADVAVVVVVPGVVLSLDGAWVIALLALTLVLGLRTWRSLPAAFALAPLGPSPPGREPVPEPSDKPLAARSWGPAIRGPASRHMEREGAETAAAAGAGWELRFKLLLYVWQENAIWLASFGFGVLIALWALRDGVDLDSLTGIGLLSFLSLFVFPLVQMARLSCFDPLPIRRSVLFAALVLPNAGALVLGYGAFSSQYVREDHGYGLELPFVLLPFGLPCLLLLAIAFRTVHAKAVAGMVILLIFVLPAFIPEAVQGALDDLLRQLGASRAGALAAWLVTAFLLLGGYVLARASFERIELPTLLPLIPGDLGEAFR